MVRINPPTKIKQIQFLGSPFQGKQAQELKERVKAQKESQQKVLSPKEPSPQAEEWEVLVCLPQEDQK